MLRRSKDTTGDLLSAGYRPQSREEAEAALSARPEDLAATRAFAEQYGLQVIEENTLARRVRLSGTARQMAEAFGITLGEAESSTGHRFLTYKGTISVPEPLGAAVTAVLGLDQRPVARPATQ